MTLLSTQDLNAMRVVAEQALPDTCVIQGGTINDDGGGGGTLTWTNRGTVACRVAPMNGAEREIADRITADTNWIITLPATTAVTEESRIVVSGDTYSVETVRARRSWEVSRRVECGKVA